MKTRSNQSYDHKSEEEYKEFMANYENRINKVTSEKYLLECYDRNNLVRWATWHREDRFIANQKIKIIKKRIEEVLNGWKKFEDNNLYIQWTKNEI